ncbi:MAG: RimK family alpha-L-glutamate ligase [Dehalococcoidia bacterium]
MHGPLVIATCRAWPQPSESDRLYLDALARRGVEVRYAPWNGEIASFMSAGAVVLRSTWDYHHDLAAFRRWLGLLEVAAVPVLNPPALVRWNLDKRYLLELQAAGVRIPRTSIAPREPSALRATLEREGWGQAVLKPAWGASGFGIRRVDAGDPAVGDATGTPSRPMLLQEFLPEIACGEVSLVYLGGEFSHAVLKRPAPGEFRVNSQYGGIAELCDPAEAMRAAGAAVVDALPVAPLYARVDGVLREGALVVMEVELHEPGLWLHLAPGSAERFADATLQRLGAAA